MKALKTLINTYNRYEEHLMVVFLGIMLAVVFVQVILRYVFNSGLSWSEEGARFLFMWIIWISMSIGFRDRSHIRMTILPDHLSERGKLLLNCFNNALILIFSVYIAYLGWKYIGRLITTMQTAPATKLPYAIVYACLPISISICSIRVVMELCEDIGKLKGKGEK